MSLTLLITFRFPKCTTYLTDVTNSIQNILYRTRFEALKLGYGLRSDLAKQKSHQKSISQAANCGFIIHCKNDDNPIKTNRMRFRSLKLYLDQATYIISNTRLFELLFSSRLKLNNSSYYCEVSIVVILDLIIMSIALEQWKCVSLNPVDVCQIC